MKGLKHNLLSISQLCDKGYKIIFEPNICMLVCEAKFRKILLFGKRVNNMDMLNICNIAFNILVFVVQK